MHDEHSPAWLVYSACVAAFISDQHRSVDTSVQPNVILQAAISGAARQVDLLIDHRWQRGLLSELLLIRRIGVGVSLGDVERNHYH